MPSEGHIQAAWRILVAQFDPEGWSMAGKIVSGLSAAVVTMFATESATKAILLLLALVVFWDFVTGIRVAWLKGHFTRSRLLGRLVDKSLAYGALATTSIAAGNTLKDWAWVSVFCNLVLSGAVFSEWISVLENCSALGLKWAGVAAKKLRVKVDALLDNEELDGEAGK